MNSFFGPYIDLSKDFCKLYKDGQIVELKPNINSDGDYIKDKWIDIENFKMPEFSETTLTEDQYD